MKLLITAILGLVLSTVMVSAKVSKGCEESIDIFTETAVKKDYALTVLFGAMTIGACYASIPTATDEEKEKIFYVIEITKYFDKEIMNNNKITL